ncbi:hypothetical protein ACP70R_033142 [Stipagrostis hirtigluma subsp. patula]
MDIDAIPDELLELILLRLGSPVFLLRAASACKRWRRIVAGAGFLGRFRSLHGPPVVGVFRQTEPPFPPNSPRKRPRPRPWPRPSFVPSRTHGDCRFSLDFLPDLDATRPSPWRIVESRGSLLLLDCVDRDGEPSSSPFLDMVVCEPATRRYRRIAPRSDFHWLMHVVCYVFLLDGDGHGDGDGREVDGMSNFKVLCVLYRQNYRSGRSYHHAGVLTPGGSPRKIEIKGEDIIFVGATSSSVYWHIGGRTMLALHRSTLQFSSFLLPLPNTEDFDGRIFPDIARRRDGEARIVVSREGGNLMVFARIDDSSEWALEKNIQLSGYQPWYFGKPAHVVATLVSLLTW